MGWRQSSLMYCQVGTKNQLHMGLKLYLRPSRKRGVGHNFWNQKIHQYIYGRKFQLVTDHKPLTTISSLKTGLPTLAAARLQHWAIMLSDYQYDIEFWSMHKHGNADCLSRLPLKVPAGTE